MSNCKNNDNKLQMRRNIQEHRQKLLNYLENTNDTVLKPKIKLVSNNLNKYNSKQNVKPKIASRAEKLPSLKLETTIKVTNHETSSAVQVKNIKPVINTTAKHPEALTNIDLLKRKPSSTVIVNQPQPNIEIKDIESPPVLKKLKEQLLEELFDSSSSEEIDDNISVGSNEDWYNSSNSNFESAFKYDEHEQSISDKSEKEYLFDSDDNLNTKKENDTKIKYNSTKHRFRKPQDRTQHNAKERACRERIANRFAALQKCCSYLNTNRRVPSKHSILLAAKKECDLLQHFEKRLLVEKEIMYKENETLKKRLKQLYRHRTDCV